MYLSVEELKTHIYKEETEAIMEGDATIPLASITAAIELAKTRLAKDYDIDKIFAQRGNDRNPLLLKVIKDIAVWEFIGLANPSVDYEDKKFRYLQAMDWLKAVYNGMPAGLPLKEDGANKVKSFSYQANPPRKHHY